jgi:hypothetical protein
MVKPSSNQSAIRRLVWDLRNTRFAYRLYRSQIVQLVAPMINSNPRSTTVGGPLASKKFAPTLPIAILGVRIVDNG